MNGEQIVLMLAWLGLLVWLTALVLLIVRRHTPAAALQLALALTVMIPPAVGLLKWGIDPAAYTLRYGAAALGELRLYAVLVGIALLTLFACLPGFRGRRGWIAFASLLNGANIAFWFYLAYFFRIF